MGRSSVTRRTIEVFWAGLEGITGKKAVDSDTMTVKN
jgi:hypothetical protein